MPLQVRKRDQVCNLAVEGEMTIYTAAENKAALFEHLDDCEELELDLSAVNEIDSAGLQILLVLKREAAVAGRQLRLVNHSQAVFEVLDRFNTSRRFTTSALPPVPVISKRSMPVTRLSAICVRSSVTPLPAMRTVSRPRPPTS